MDCIQFNLIINIFNGQLIVYRLVVNIPNRKMFLYVNVKVSELFLRLDVADGRGVVGAHRRAADCVAHGLFGRESGTAPAQRQGGRVARRDGDVIWRRRRRCNLVSGRWKMADGMHFLIMSQLWCCFKTCGMNSGDAALTQTPRRADCLVCLISISSLTDSQNLDMILSSWICKKNNQGWAISSAAAKTV